MSTKMLFLLAKIGCCFGESKSD